MIFPMWIVMVVSLASFKLIVASTSVTYVDTLIANFLSKEIKIWEKIEKQLSVLLDIQLIVSKDNTDVPSDYMYGIGGDVSGIVRRNKFAESYNIVDNFWSHIMTACYREINENRSNLTMHEIDQRYSEVNTLSNGLFNLTSQNLFWQYGVAKMASKSQLIVSVTSVKFL